MVFGRLLKRNVGQTGATMSNDDLNSSLDAVSDRNSFFDFVRVLLLDRQLAAVAEARSPSSPYGPDVGGWESTSIEMYLEACICWIISTDTDLGVTAAAEK